MLSDSQQTEPVKSDGGTPPPPIPPAEAKFIPPPPAKRESAMPALLGLPLRWADTAIIVILATTADFCLYGRPGGAGAACVLMAGLIGLLLAQRRTVNFGNWALAILVLLIAAMMTWRHWWLLHALGWASLFALAAKGRRSDWPLLEALWAAVQTAVQAPLRLCGHCCSHESKRGHSEVTPTSIYNQMTTRVIVVPIAVTAVFILIFAAANPVVARLLQTAGTHVQHFFRHIGEYITPGRTALWMLWLACFAALIRPVVKSAAADWLMTLDEGLKADAAGTPHRSNFAAALCTLISVNVLFLAYNGMDSIYLYFKATLPEGITWTDYTHRGCGWLTLGLFASSTVLGVIFWHGMNFHPRARGLKTLSYIWAAQNGVLAVGTMRRIQMYISYSGLTHLRLTGIYGSLLVAAGLGIMVYKVHANRGFLWLMRRYVLAFFSALTILALTPNDWVCTTYNVRRIMEHRPRALRPVFLKKLSPEALPPLIPLLDYEREDGDEGRERMVREGIAALLGQHLNQLEAQGQRPWSKRCPLYTKVTVFLSRLGGPVASLRKAYGGCDSHHTVPSVRGVDRLCGSDGRRDARSGQLLLRGFLGS